MRRWTCGLVWLLGMSIAVAAAASQVSQTVVTPEEYLGFRPGTDRKLLDYDQLIEYLQLVADSSPRVRMREIGHTGMGRTMYAVFVSAETNLDRLDELQAINRRLALDTDIPEPELDRLVTDGRVFLVAANSMHASEVGPAQSVPLLIHQLATTDDPALLEILANVVLMVVPTQNPDGMQMMVDHYRASIGTPYEGGSLPGVYNMYVGHDNNRDFVTLSQPEAQAVNRLFSTEWYPHVLLDKHQMGLTGPRYFVPEYHDPIAVNIDEELWYWSDVFGSTMSKDFGRAGLAGVASHWVFDDYWPGSTTTSHWKGVISLLTEAASCKLATPVFVEPTELSVHGKGLAEYKKGVNLLDPWPGGWWRLSDIVQYELVSMVSALRIASVHRGELLRFRNQLSRKEVERGRSEPPYYYILPRAQHDADALAEVVDVLLEHGVQVSLLTEATEVSGRTFAAGDVVVSLNQPYRAFVKEVMETQRYPVRHYTPGGKVIRPYDITSWSLPLNFGLECAEIDNRSSELESRLQALPADFGSRAPAAVPSGSWGVGLSTNNNLSYRTVFAALGAGLRVERAMTPVELDEITLPAGSFLVSGGSARLQSVLDETGPRAVVLPRSPEVETKVVRLPRVAVVETYFHDMDAGWTRFVLDSYGIDFKTVRPGEIRDLDLAGSFDVVIFPDSDKDLLMKGMHKRGDRYIPGDLSPEYRKPIAPEGMARLKSFLQAGGIVVSWGDSTALFLDGLKGPKPDDDAVRLPARDVSESLAEKGLYVAGALVAADLLPNHPLTWGMPERTAVFSWGSPVFATSIPILDTDRRVIAVHPDEKIVVSGYVEEPELLAERPVAVWLRWGRGQLALYGFNPHHRASTSVTYKLLFNALLLPEVGAAP